MRSATAGAALLLTCCVAAGCGDDPDTASDRTSDGAAGPTTLQPAAATSPDGTRRVTCEVRSSHGRVTFAFDLPAAFEDAGDCRWRMRATAPADSAGLDGDVVVAVTAPKPKDTLQKIDDLVEPDAVAGDDPEVDDSVLHLEFDQDTPVFGDTVGDRLSYDCFCDGQELLSRYAQADGVRLSWDSYWFITEQTDEQFDAAIASAGVVR